MYGLSTLSFFEKENVKSELQDMEKLLPFQFHQHQKCDSRTGFIFVRTIFVQNGKCSPFLELTPTL